MSQDPLKSLRRRAQTQTRPSAFPDPLYDELVLQQLAEQAPAGFPEAALDVHLAHVVMLIERRIVEPDRIPMLLAPFATAPAGEQGHTLESIERHIAEATEGRALLALGRRESLRAVTLLVLRPALLDLADALLDLRASVAAQAMANINTVVLASSQGQSVQPTTLGHYFCAQLGPLARSSQRIADSWPRLNRSPLGAVSGMATSLPIDRERTAGLLAFDDVADNTFDALASYDVMHEVAGLLSLFAAECLRLIGDVSYWARDDVGVVVPDESFVHVGHVEPQRREPHVLDYLRLRLREHIDASAAAAAIATESRMLGSDAAEWDLSSRIVREVRQAERSLRLLGRVIQTLVVNRATSAQRVNRGFATSSELTDLFVVDFGLAPAEARILTEHIVVDALRSGIDITGMKPDMVERVALRVVGRELGIEPEQLSRCLAPKRFLERRALRGGPAPSAVSAALDRETLAARRDRAWVRDRRQALLDARSALWARREELLRDPSSARRGHGATKDADGE